MAVQKKNIVKGMILFVFALSVLGFRSAGDTSREVMKSPNSSNFYGSVVVSMNGEALLYDGINWTQVRWHPMDAQLPITRLTPDGKGLIQDESIFSFAESDSIIAGGMVVQRMIFPTQWKFYGILYPPPDCSLELSIKEIEYPGFVITCTNNPFSGCSADVWQPNYYTGIEIKVPYGKWFGTADISVYNPNLSGNFTVFLLEQDSPDGSCDFKMGMP